MHELISPQGGAGSSSLESLEWSENLCNADIRQLLFEAMQSDAQIVSEVLSSRSAKPDISITAMEKRGLLRKSVSTGQTSHYWIVRERPIRHSLPPSHHDANREDFSLSIRHDGVIVYLQGFQEQVLREETLIPWIPHIISSDASPYPESHLFYYPLDGCGATDKAMERSKEHLSSWRADLVRLGQRIGL